VSALWLFSFWACDETTPGDVDDGPASVAILAPADGEVVCGSPLVVETEVSGIDLIDPYDPPDPPPPGSGHLDVMLNGQDAAMSDQEVVEIALVEDGEYQLKVELSNADHTPLEPYAGDFLYITVDAGVCP